MTYFEQDFITFFEELTLNNNKDWFHTNKKRYENSVKKPFEAFITDLIDKIRAYDSTLEIGAKDCVLRINRDIRFAKDKSPYNLHYTAFVSSGGKKDKSIPGIFIRFSPEMIGIMGGCFGPDKDQLAMIRRQIQSDNGSLRKLVASRDFQNLFGELKGEEMKRIPKDLQAAVEVEPFIAKKQFYFVAELDSAHITQETLMDTVMKHWHAMRPLNEYLKQAIS